MTLAQYGVLASAVVTLCLAARIVFILLLRTAVAGRVLSHDYDDAERRHERNAMTWTLGESSGWGHPTDEIPVRTVRPRVSYTYQGVEYRNDVAVTVLKGCEPEALLGLWINPDDPNDVTARGPGYWFAWLLLAGAFAIGFWHLPL